MTNQLPQQPLVLLVDWTVSPHRKFWLQAKLEESGFQVHVEGIPDYDMRNRQVRWGKLLLWKQYLQLGIRGARAAQSTGGVVVAWNFVVGAFAALAQRTSRHPAPAVVSLNMIFFDKGWLLNRLRRIAYRCASAEDRMVITVNSETLRDQYLAAFRFHPENVRILHDAWDPQYPVSEPSSDDEGYVFSGGEAARDWETLLAVALAHPEVPFKVVARKMHWRWTGRVPANVEVFFDTSEEEFYALASRCRMVLLPLSSNVTSGLIVLIRCTLLGRPVIATQTYGTMPYYPQECRDLMVPMAAADLMGSTLMHYWNDGDRRLAKAKALQAHVLGQFSPEAYARQVAELVAYARIVGNGR